MEFHQLAAAVAVADHGSFTAAATALGLSQPSVSQAVRALERDVGVTLFERSAPGARPTVAGLALLGPARQALHDRDLVRAAVDDIVGLSTGTVDIGCIPAVAADLVTPVVGGFRRRHPGVTVRIGEPVEGESLGQRVADGHWEVGFGVVPMEGRGLVTVTLGRQDLVAVLSRGHAAALARDGVVSIEALGDLSLITAPAGSASFLQLEAALGAVGRALTPAVETIHRDTIVPLVLAGAGAAVVPRRVAEAGPLDGVAVVDLDPPVTRRVGLVHRDGVLSPAAAAIVTLAREVSG